MNENTPPETRVSRRDKAILFGLVIIIIISVLVYLVITWQSNKSTDTDTESEETSQEIEVEKIAATEVRRLLESDEPLILIDVRQPIEYAEEHIDGATNIQLTELENMKKYLPTDVDLIVMCDGSNCNRSGAAAQMLVESGFKRVRDFAGGTEEWKKEAYPTTIGVVSEVGYLQIPEISASELDSAIDSGVGINLLDVRSSVDYAAGHIPSARNISFADAENMAQTNAINLDRTIVVYGGSNDLKAEMTAQTLLANGASDISILTSGYPGWVEAGYITE